MIWHIWTTDEWGYLYKGNKYRKHILVFARNFSEANYKAYKWFEKTYGFDYGHATGINWIGLKIKKVI